MLFSYNRYKKAFDFLDHSLMLITLEKFGFGTNFNDCV